MKWSSARRFLLAAMLFLLPSWVLAVVLPLMGCSMRRTARVGFSIILVDRLHLGEGARIGHLNLLACRKILLRHRARVGSLNFIRGPIALCIAEKGWIANRNQATRARPPVVKGPARLRIGRGAGVTTGHRIDCTASVNLGEYAILAGSGTQVWTHGYVHEITGPGRYRIDGAVSIGRNVYVGARCLFNLGVTVCDGAIVGAGVVVSRSLLTPSMFVGAAMRELPRPPPPGQRSDMTEVQGLCETVYRKTARH